MSLTFEIPPGLTDLLQDFTVAVLKEYPEDIVQFAADYFAELNDRRHGGGDSLLPGLGRGVQFNAKAHHAHSNESDDDVMSDDEGPPRSNMNRRQSVAAESFDPEKMDDDDEQEIIYPKSDDQRKRLGQAVQHILLFRCLDEEQMCHTINAMFERKVEVGEKVITQGEDGDNFYVIESGKYDIFVKIDGGDKRVGEYDGKGSFGELALMYNTPRAATIVATTPGIVWAMDRATFRSIVLKRAFLKRQMYENLLESVPLLKELSMYERTNVADALRTCVFEDSVEILRQGDVGTEMYFVEEGEVRITRKNTSNEEVEIKRLKKGDYFGELALVTHQPRAASAYASGKTKVAVLDVASFERLLGPCISVMGRNIDSYEKQLREIFGSEKDIPDLRGAGPKRS